MAVGVALEEVGGAFVEGGEDGADLELLGRQVRRVDDLERRAHLDRPFGKRQREGDRAAGAGPDGPVREEAEAARADVEGLHRDGRLADDERRRLADHRAGGSPAVRIPELCLGHAQPHVPPAARGSGPGAQSKTRGGPRRFTPSPGSAKTHAHDGHDDALGRRERLRLQGMEGHLLPREDAARRDARLVRRAAALGRDQQHLLPDAQGRGARALGRSDAETFRFAIKASRRITHDARLKADEAADSVAYLYRNLATLGAKRGPVLFQLPPFLKKDLPRLNDFLHLLPEGHRAVFEFRNESWFDDDVYAALHSAGAALCLSEREDNAPPPLVETALWGYLRLRLESYSEGRPGAVGRAARRDALAGDPRVLHARTDGAGVCDEPPARPRRPVTPARRRAQVTKSALR